MKQAFVTRFDGGMVNDIRSSRDGAQQLTQNFDTNTYSHRLVPFHDSESGNDDTSRTIQYLAAARGRVYGLGGLLSDPISPTVYYKTSLTDATWLTTANNQPAAGTFYSSTNQCFTYYKGYFYGHLGNYSIFKYDATGTDAFVESDMSTSPTVIGTCYNGVVHSKDDALYIPIDNKIYKKIDSTTWYSGPALTLPTDLFVTAVCEYGNFLAIATQPLSLSGRPSSKVYLWDRDSTLANIPQVVDFGAGILTSLFEVDGQLLGISTDDNHAFSPFLKLRQYDGASGSVLLERLTGDVGTTFDVTRTPQKVNNRAYFALRCTIGGVAHRVVASVGRNSPNSPFGFSFDYSVLNDSTDVSDIRSNLLVGDYMFVAYLYSGTYYISKTNDASSYTATSIWESNINPGMEEKDKILNKSLMAIGVSYDPIPTAGQVVLKYKVDGGSWTTIFTETTDSQIVTERVMTDSGTRFTSGREYQFRIESTGGAQITGVKYLYDILQTNILI